MHGRCVTLCLTVMALGTLLPAVASDQTLSSERDAWVQSLTPWGDPDLQGLWTNTTTTPLQRPRDLAEKEFLTAEELAVRDRQVADKVNLDKRSLDSPVSETGAYNNFWMERGRLGARTSHIVDHAAEHQPPKKPEEKVLQSQHR